MFISIRVLQAMLRVYYRERRGGFSSVQKLFLISNLFITLAIYLYINVIYNTRLTDMNLVLLKYMDVLYTSLVGTFKFIRKCGNSPGILSF